MSRLAYFARETAISLRRNLGMTIAGILTVAVSLSLFGGILLMQQLVSHGTSRWKDVKFEVFMNVDATDAAITGVSAELDALVEAGEVRSYEFLDKNEAYEEFKRIFEDEPALIESTTPEVLPTSFRVVPVQVEDTEVLAQRFTSMQGVDKLLTAQEVIDRIVDVTNYFKWAMWSMAGVLLLAAVFLIMNTIRLATFARRREIEVMKLVGASNSFVRIPFMTEGFVQGVIGAGFAVGGIYTLKLVLGRIESTDGLWRDFYVTNSDALVISMIVLAIGAVIGVFASIIGLLRFLED